MGMRTWRKYSLIFSIGTRIIMNAVSMIEMAMGKESEGGEKITPGEAAIIIGQVVSIATEEVEKIMEEMS